MSEDKPHLTLVNEDFTPSTDHDQEFVPLPFYPWDERPSTLPIDTDEAATAIHLAQAHLPAAAALLKVPLIRLQRLLNASPRLQRIFSESAGLIVAKAFSKYIEALDAPDARRQEWGATKIMQSRAAIGHLFSPAPAQGAVSASMAVNQQNREIVFSWRDPGRIDINEDAGSSSVDETSPSSD